MQVEGVEEEAFQTARHWIPTCNIGQLKDMVRNAAPYTLELPKCNCRFMSYGFFVEDGKLKAMYKLITEPLKTTAARVAIPFDKTAKPAILNPSKTGCALCDYTGSITVFDQDEDGGETRNQIPCECRRSQQHAAAAATSRKVPYLGRRF